MSYTAVNDVVRAMDLDARVLSLAPRRVDGILSAADTVAAAIGREQHASAVRVQAGSASARCRGRTRMDPRVVFVEWLDPLSPGGHWVPEQIGYAGGTSVFLGPGANSVPVPRSYVAYNPSSPNGHRRLRTPTSRWP